jgi:multidrug efflux system outer membrane protein
VQGDAASVAASRAANEHALAVLVGKPPSELTAQVPPLNAAPPSIPAGIPSSVLERRPDIKRAVSGIAAANARIGVARTGYFPDISLSAMGGFSSGDLSDLFKWSNRTWLVGPMAGTVLTQPIFEGGRLSAAKAQSQADYGVAVAEYRSAVLQAFREVEDQLSGLRYTNEQAKAARTGLASANRAFTVADARFKAGYSSHIDYLDAQRSKLSAERSDIQQRGNQYITTIQLVKALGGSWQAPTTPETTAPVAP